MTNKEWKLTNKERVKTSNHNYWKRWIIENKEKRKEYFRIFERSKENKEEWQQCIKRWKRKNPEKVKMYHKITRTRRNGAKGSHSLKEWEDLKKQCNFACLDCKRKEPEIKLTEDHIIPLIKGGSNWIKNIQPLCGSCNSKKFTKIISFIEQPSSTR